MTQSDIPDFQPTLPPIDGDAEQLTHKLVEMQAQISLLETELDRLRHKKKPDRETWITRLTLITALLLAAIPPALVIAQQWLNI